ncbi:MAG: UDP-3-O-acyl-N-acetylglucosamine deacetylase [Planctomycetia bacterium]|jgi:UDP-3-O-acyl N-acetylglucosamine deacetylase
MSKIQHTLASNTVPIEGRGYWSGEPVRVEFRPAEVDAGLTFVRSDLPGCPRIPATVENRIQIPLRTSLQAEGARVDMVEHILAALGGLGVDNCEIWVDRPEMPACDGSSLAFVDAIDEAGLISQGIPRKTLCIDSVVRASHGQSHIEAIPMAGENLTLAYHLDYGEGPIGRQSLRLLLTPESFRRELAPARTFIRQEEAARLQAEGLGTHVSPRDLLIFGPDGPIDNHLRYEDECVRHKLLDLVGDLTLAGCRLIGAYTADRSGHFLNGQLVRKLLFPEQQTLTIFDGEEDELRKCA